MMGIRHSYGLIPALVAAFLSPSAEADNFGRVRYDRQTDELVVTMIYGGTNSHHRFSIKWGKCQADQSTGLPGATAEILDDQFEDVEAQDFTKTVRFSLAGLPCPRPASVTLRTAPRFFYTLTIPG